MNDNKMKPFYWNGNYIGDIPAEDEKKLRAAMRDIEGEKNEPAKEEVPKKDPIKEYQDYANSSTANKMTDADKKQFELEWRLTTAYVMRDWAKVGDTIRCISKRQL